MTLKLRVLARHLVAMSFGDPKQLLGEFEQGVSQVLTMSHPKLEAAKEVLEEIQKNTPSREDEARGRAENPDWGKDLLERSRKNDAASKDAITVGNDAYRQLVSADHYLSAGHKLFLSLIQTYTLPPAIRKKVEIASRMYLKPIKFVFKGNTRGERALAYITAYMKLESTLRAQVEVARMAVAQGKAHSEEGADSTRIKAGPFMVVNTGGFSEKVMAEVVDIVLKASAHLHSKGFSKICYGDIQVTNTIHKASFAAFYMVAKDEMFIRANLKGKHDVLRYVIHEFGHRLDHKFLQGKQIEINTMYKVLKDQEDFQRQDQLKAPPEGEIISVKGVEYKVLRTEYSSHGRRVRLSLVEAPALTSYVSLEGYLQLQGRLDRDLDTPDYKGFVTDYAKTKSGENFAEMFSFYCLNKLPAAQVPLFESIVG
jgi:hypothetical protein